jgi:hypothetical protein
MTALPRLRLVRHLDLNFTGSTALDASTPDAAALANDEMVRFKALVAGRLKAQPKGGGDRIQYLSSGLDRTLRSRRSKNGEDLYRVLGIARKDRPQRQKQFARNFEFFGAPVGLIFAVERQMGSAMDRSRHVHAVGHSASGAGRVKTSTSRERAELFSLFPFFDSA